MKTVFCVLNLTVGPFVAYLGKGGWTSKSFARRFTTSEGALAALALVQANEPRTVNCLAIEPREVYAHISAE